MTGDVAAYVCANLPSPPARILEVGAGEGRLAQHLREAGHDVLAIDPEPGGPGVDRVSLHELDEPPASFAAAVAVVSLHHVEPLPESVDRLASLLAPGGTLVVDEFDVAAFDTTAAGWWLEQRGAEHVKGRTAADLVGEHRSHLHPVERIVETLQPAFRVGLPIRGAYLYRWDLDESLRPVEERLIAERRLPAVGVRFVAIRR